MKPQIFFIIFVLLGCGRTTSANNGQTTSDSKLIKLQPLLNPENEHVVVGSKKRKKAAFEEYRKLCSSVENTVYDERDQVCRCENIGEKKYKFSLVKSRRARRHIEPRCVEVSSLKPPEGFSSFEELLKESGRDDFIKVFEGRSQKHRTISTFKFAKELSDNFYYALARELDINPIELDLPPYYGIGGGLFVNVGYSQGLADELNWEFKNLSNIWGNYSRTPALLIGPKYSLFVRDAKRFRAIVGMPKSNRRGWDFPNVPKVDNNYEELKDLRLATIDLNKYLFRGGEELQDSKMYVSIIEDGCHLRCFTSLEYTSHGKKFRYEKMYIYGEIVAARLLRFEGDVISPGGAYSSMVYFGKGDSISTVVVNRKSTEGVSAGWVLDIYDENMDMIIQYDETRIHDPSSLLSALAIPNEKIEESTPVLLLEGLIDYRDADLMRWVKKGPYRSKSYLSGGSVLGWKNAAKNDVMGYQYSSFFDGLFTDNLNNPSAEEQYYHANIVGRQILGSMTNDVPISLVPTSSHDYTNDRMQNLYRIVNESGARVINYSAIVLVDGEKSCPLNDTRLSVEALWVLGAGNDNLENPRDTCEQNMKPKHRRLVVAANIEGGLELEYYSDFGTDYADLSASGVGQDMHGDRYEGTSYAAPKVSNAAATIVNRYGSNLTNQLIRLAILLSVDVNVDSPMKTRSGGRLNKENALAAAAYMNGIIDGSIDFPYNLTKRQIMARIIKASGSLTDDRKISKQVDWLVSNGI